MDLPGDLSPGKPPRRKNLLYSFVFVGAAVMVICYHFCSPLRPRDLTASSPASSSRRKKEPTCADVTHGSNGRGKLPRQTGQGLTGHPNASSPAPRVRLVYNRVPKCASTTLLTLLRRLSATNGFRHLHCRIYDKRMLTSDEQAEFVEEVMSLRAPCSYDRHVYFLDFEEFGHANPTYINMVRDPVDRIASSFYYSRAIAARRRDPTLRKVPPRWLRETFEECVQRGGDGCCFAEGQPHRSLMVPYFCGHDPRCLIVQNSWALDKARQNIERHFSVVGVLEDLNTTLALLETSVPIFFRGAAALYRKEGLHKNRNWSGPSKVALRTREMLRRNISLEYELYEFVRQRLHAQWRRLAA
ncbi:uronyl 2-sulfotransferase isoform X1 [Dermacentor albipictus]|uniref:uronyl 2-sulfotransferase isoform X1 n=2 Tax=Dermacentor albipictus TaxID=60249 RepID=UPI0031FD3DA3